MSALPLGGRDLTELRAVPARKQLLLAPSTVTVNVSNMGAQQCVCALQITDPVNLHIYYVPMTPTMVRELRANLYAYDPANVGSINEGNNDS